MTDTVQVTDSLGNTATATVSVTAGASISPTSVSLAPKASQTLTATGGSGTGYAWSISSNNSGGSIIAGTGVYTAGATGGVTDTVQVTDSLGNVATRTVTVTAGVGIAGNASTAPKAVQTFTASGGSDTGYVWSITTNGSGGNIGASTGVYTAGSVGNTSDIVRVVDSLGNAAILNISVSVGVSISPSSVTLTAGDPQTFTASGGSGTGYAWSITTNNSGGNIGSGTGFYTAGSTGGITDTIQVTDSLGNTATRSITVVAAPSISNFNASPASVNVGSSSVLSYTFTGASAKIGTSAGASDVAASVTSGGTTNVSPGITTTYYLTVANAANATFSATTILTVNQPVTISGNVGVAGATISYTDGTAKTVTANGAGAYSLLVSYGWSGTVIPAMAGYTFNPIKRSYANATANASSENFTATAATGDWNSYAAGSYGGGDGSIGNPYLIATPEQLARLSLDAAFDPTFSAGKYFTQVADLDLGAHPWVPIAEFRGTFDGGNYRTQNLNIDNASGYYLGVFGKLNSGALVSNLGVVNASLNGYFYVGAVAGFASTATVSHCYSSGTITGWGMLGGIVGAMDTAFDLSYSQSSCAVTGSAPNDQSYSGGLIGALWSGTTTVSNCFATGTITGWENIGGLIGLTYHPGSLSMTNCFSTGNVITTRTNHWWGNVGGLVGVCASTVNLTNVYHSGTVTMLYPPDNAGKTGGIVGGNEGSLTVTNGYYNSANTPGQGGGTPLTTADMRAGAFLVALNGVQDPAPWVADGTGANQGFPLLAGLTGLTAPQLYVTNLGSNTLTVFGLKAQDNQAPARVLGGSNTGLNGPHSVAFGTTDLYIANHLGHNVTVFAKDASGDTAPIRTIQGAATGISNPVELVLQAGELFLTNYGSPTRVFASTAGGDVAPLRTIDVPATSYGMCVNGDEVFLSRHPDSGDSNTVYVFSRTASGAAAPLRTITGANTQFNFVGGLAVADGELFVTNYFGSSVAVFDLAASGNVAPKRVISGALTSMGNPRAIRVYGGEVFVANQAGGDSVLVFNVSDSGNVAPKRILKGAATGLSSPGGLLIQ